MPMTTDLMPAHDARSTPEVDRAGAPDADAPGRIERSLSASAVIGRWVVVASGAVPLALGERTPGAIAALALLGVAATTATVLDRHRRRSTPGSLQPTPDALVLEVLTASIAVALSGGLGSAVVLAPAVPLVLAGHALSRHRIAALASFATVAASLLVHGGLSAGASPRTLALVLTIDGLSVALGVAVRVVEDAYVVVVTQRDDRLDHLSAANRNLMALFDFARSTASSLDLGEVLQSIEGRVSTLARADYLTFYVCHEATGQWVPELSRGTRAVTCPHDDDLPYSLRRALHTSGAVVLDDGLRHHAATVAPLARSGVYMALRSGDRVVGLIAVEHDVPGTYDQRDAAALGAAAEELALTVDNALWFARLRTIGAEAERARIARELHDRIAQSVTYASFELERLSSSAAPPSPEELQGVHTVVRGVAMELRDTLFDLRSTVTEDDDLATVASRFVQRLEERHGVEVRCRFRVEERLPVIVEVEIWRIVQEALQNFVRHAETRRADLTIDVRDGSAHVSLRDYGCGFSPRQVSAGHFGLVGMRERADAIGARLGVESRPQHGTLVRVDLEVPR